MTASLVSGMPQAGNLYVIVALDLGLGAVVLQYPDLGAAGGGPNTDDVVAVEDAGRLIRSTGLLKHVDGYVQYQRVRVETGQSVDRVAILTGGVTQVENTTEVNKEGVINGTGKNGHPVHRPHGAVGVAGVAVLAEANGRLDRAGSDVGSGDFTVGDQTGHGTTAG